MSRNPGPVIHLNDPKLMAYALEAFRFCPCLMHAFSGGVTSMPELGPDIRNPRSSVAAGCRSPGRSVGCW